jgi:CheY-like chemotaxis protein
VLFPATAVPAALQPADASQAAAATQACILVVDDEQAVRTIAREALTRAGFTVVLAEDGAAAVERFGAMAAAIDAVLLDMTMPGLSGIETLRAIHTIRRDLPVILTSGYSEQEAADRCSGEVIAGFIQKPFGPSALVARINDALAIMPGHDVRTSSKAIDRGGIRDRDFCTAVRPERADA